MKLRPLNVAKCRKNPDAALNVLWDTFPKAAKVVKCEIVGDRCLIELEESDNPFDSYWVQTVLEKMGIPCFGEEYV